MQTLILSYIPILAMIFSTMFTVAALYLLRYRVPRRNASLFLSSASIRPARYGTGPSLDVGDDLKSFEGWKYRDMMEQLLRLKHRIYLESELHDHRTAGGSRAQTEDPSGAQQAMAMSIGSELRELASSLREKQKAARLSWFMALFWSVIGGILYGLLFGGIVSLYPEVGGADPIRTLAPFFLPGLVVAMAASAYFGSRNWSDYHTLRAIETEIREMMEMAEPFLAYNNIRTETIL